MPRRDPTSVEWHRDLLKNALPTELQCHGRLIIFKKLTSNVFTPYLFCSIFVGWQIPNRNLKVRPFSVENEPKTGSDFCIGLKNAAETRHSRNRNRDCPIQSIWATHTSSAGCLSVSAVPTVLLSWHCCSVKALQFTRLLCCALSIPARTLTE